jgi:hypothetical protein
MNSIVALPVLTAVPTTAPAITPVATIPTDDQFDWTKPECEIIEIYHKVKCLDQQIAMRSTAFEEWKVRNPWPVAPEYDSHDAEISDFSRHQSTESAYVVRYQNALRQCGRGRFQKQRLDLIERYREICGRLATVPARTLSDIQKKARLARLESGDGAIRAAVLRDVEKLSA